MEGWGAGEGSHLFGGLPLLPCLWILWETRRGTRLRVRLEDKGTAGNGSNCDEGKRRETSGHLEGADGAVGNEVDGRSLECSQVLLWGEGGA